MIQRIQTVYLLLIAGLMLAMLFLPLSSFAGADGSLFIFKALGVTSELKVVFETWPVVIPVVAVVVNSLIVISQYKKRPLQLKLAGTNVLLILAFYCAFFYYAWSFMKTTPVEITIGFSLAFPLVALLLNLLAVKAIKKDEKLVRSLNRIR